MSDDAPNPRPRASDYRWQGQQPGSAGRSAGPSRRFWLVSLFGLFLALLSVVVLWAFLIRPTPSLPIYVAINIVEFNKPLFEPLGSTGKDAERILPHFPVPRNEQPETKERQLLQKELAALARRPENVPLILHLTAQAVVRDKKVFLIPGDADPDEEATWFDVQDVLSAMDRCKAKEKLLILDLAHGFTDARVGVLSDRVAETLEAVLQNAKLTYPVLCPCSPGQYSLTSEVMQGSVFAYYLEQGLQGYADTSKDRTITVQELAAFVEARVERWARLNRGVQQKPRLFVAGPDFAVAVLGDEMPESTIKIDAYPDRLQKAWAQRDGLRDKAISKAPRFLHRLEANLLRQEKLWKSGAKPSIAAKTLDADLQNLFAILDRNTREPSAPPRSLALAIKEIKDNEALIDSVVTTLSTTDDGPKKAEINDKVKDELLKKLGEQKGAEFPELASVVVEALAQIPILKPDQVRVAQKALMGLALNMKMKYSPYVEHFYLQRLIDLADKIKDKNDPGTWDWETDRTKIILQTMRVNQTLIAALNREPGPLPWVSRTMLDADKLRQSGERKLLLERPSAWKDGYLEMQSAKRKYEDAMQTFESLRKARRDLNRAYAELPGYGRFICDWPTLDRQAEKAWEKGAAEATKLQAFFFDPPKLDAPVSGELVPNYQNPFTDLESMLKRRLKEANKEEGPEVLRQIECFLNLPFLTATERAALLARQRTLAAKWHAEADKLDQEDNEMRRVKANPPQARRDPNDKSIGLVRARMALDMLRIAGFDSKKKLRMPADGNPSPEEWTILERDLRSRTGKELVAALDAAKSRLSADALYRVLSPWEFEIQAALDREPSRPWNRDQRKAFFDWLQARYDAEAAAFATSPMDQGARTFYSEASSELRLKKADVE